MQCVSPNERKKASIKADMLFHLSMYLSTAVVHGRKGFIPDTNLNAGLYCLRDDELLHNEV